MKVLLFSSFSNVALKRQLLLSCKLLEKLIPYSIFEAAGVLLDPVPASLLPNSTSHNSIKFTEN